MHMEQSGQMSAFDLAKPVTRRNCKNRPAPTHHTQFTAFGGSGSNRNPVVRSVGRLGRRTLCWPHGDPVTVSVRAARTRRLSHFGWLKKSGGVESLHRHFCGCASGHLRAHGGAGPGLFPAENLKSSSVATNTANFPDSPLGGNV